MRRPPFVSLSLASRISQWLTPCARAAPHAPRLWEFGASYFDFKNTKAFPDCEARRIFERIATGKKYVAGAAASKRSGRDSDDKRDKKKRKDRR